MRRLRNADKDGADGASRAKKRKVENAQNFVLSLVLLSVHQKPFMHPPLEPAMQHLDHQRSLFRRRVLGRRVKGRRRLPEGDLGLGEGEGGKPKAPRRAQSISSVGTRRASADTSLLSYFHIRHNTEDSVAGIDEEGGADPRSSLQSSFRVGSLSIVPEPDTMRAALSGTQGYAGGEGQSPLSPDPSPSLSHVAYYPTLSSSSAPPSPLLALPTQHQVRIHDPRLLVTLDILSTVCTLAEQYLITIQELLEPDRAWLEQGRRDERARQRREQVEQDEWFTLRSQQSVSGHNGAASQQPADESSLLTAFNSRLLGTDQSPIPRRGSFTSGDGQQREAPSTTTLPSSSKTALFARTRLASAEDASRRKSLSGREGSPGLVHTSGLVPSAVALGPRSTLTASVSQTFSQTGAGHHRRTGSASSQSMTGGGGGGGGGGGVHEVGDAVYDSGEKAAPPTSTLPIGDGAVPVSSALTFHCDCDVVDSETKAEAQELICVEIINPQFNCHSEETRGRLLFMTSQITLYGRVDWIHSLHHPHSESPYVIRTHSFAAPDSPDNPRVTTHSTPPLAIISRDKFRVDVVLDDIQAFVAPTDIDVDAGVIWMNKQNVGVLKSIMRPATFQVKAQLRPEMAPVTSIRVPERRGDPVETKDAAGRTAKKERKEYEEKMLEAAALRRDDSTNLLPAVLTAGPHHVVFPHSAFNSVQVQLPEMTFNLDAYQFSLLVDVLKTVGAPMPMQGQKREEEQAAAAEDASIDELKLRAVRLQRQMIDVVWEMKDIGWLLSGIDEHPPSSDVEETDEAYERSVQQHLSASAASNLGHFETWLAETAARIEKDREAREEGHKRDGSTELHHRFRALLTEQNRVGLEFFRVVLAVRGKERRLQALKLHHLHASALVERINYQLMKNEKPMVNLYLDQLTLTATALTDSTLDTVVEVKAIGGRNLLPHYQDPSRPEFAWQEMVSLWMGGGKGIDSAWTHKDVMLHLQCTVKEDAEGLVLKHLEVNLHPVSVRITYEGLTSIIDYFVAEQQRLRRQYQKYREQFLPQSAVLDVDSHDALDADKERALLGLATPQSTSAPHSPREGGEHRKSVKAAFKGLTNFFHRHEHRPSSVSAPSLNPTAEEDEGHREEDEESVSGIGASHRQSASMTALSSYPHHTHGLSTSVTAGLRSLNTDTSDLSTGSVSVPQTPSSLASASRKLSLQRPSLLGSATAGGDAVDPTRAKKAAAPESEIYFNYLRLGSSVIVLSYFSGGSRKYNIEDIDGLPVKVKALLVQKRRWTPSQLASHVKKEVIKNALSQVTETLGRFLGMKLGVMRGEQAAPMDKVDEGSESKKEDEDEEEKEEDRSVPSSTNGSSSVRRSSLSHVDHPLPVISAPPSSSTPTKATAASVPSSPGHPKAKRLTTVGQKIGDIRGVLFGDQAKRRKDSASMGRDDPTPPALLPVPIQLGGGGAQGVVGPALPPRPPGQHTLVVPGGGLVASVSSGSLSSDGVVVGQPVRVGEGEGLKGRMRSLSTGNGAEATLSPAKPLLPVMSSPSSKEPSVK